jgi:hypothetical protein
MKLQLGASLLALAHGQWSGYGSIGDHTVRDVWKVVPNPPGRWDTPNLCPDCFNTGVIRRDGITIPISTDPNFFGQPGSRIPGPVEYVATTRTRTTPAPWPNPWGNVQWIEPQPAIVAPPVVSAPIVPRPVYTAPVVAAPVVTTPPVVLPPVPAPVVVAPPPAVYTQPAVVAPAVTVGAAAYVAPPVPGHYEGQTPPRFQGYQNVRGVPVPTFADWGGVPVRPPYSSPYARNGW